MMKTVLGPILVLALFLGLWQWATASGLISPILLPSPLDTGRYLIDSISDGLLPSALGVTLGRLVIGYALGLCGGLLLGLCLPQPLGPQQPGSGRPGPPDPAFGLLGPFSPAMVRSN